MHKHHLDVSFMRARVINFEENLAFQNMHLFGRLFVLYKKGFVKLLTLISFFNKNKMCNESAMFYVRKHVILTFQQAKAK